MGFEIVGVYLPNIDTNKWKRTKVSLFWDEIWYFNKVKFVFTITQILVTFKKHLNHSCISC